MGLVVMNGDGTEQRVIVASTRECFDPMWSPDGLHIACTGLRPGPFNPEIYVINADGSGAVNLTNNPAIDQQPVWSLDGRIAFVSRRSGAFDIWVMNADGSNPVNLTNGRTGAFPAWSPDGTRIAFTRQFDHEIHVMNADGTGETNLTNDPLFDSGPAWSPDGARIAFIRGVANGPRDLFVMNADGSGVTQVTSGIAVGSETGRLAWSPDGRRIVFEGAIEGRLHVVKVDQPGEIVDITTDAEPGFEDVHPSWTWRRN